MIKQIIFDLDGTLLDSMGIWYNVDRIFLRENNVVPPDDISDIMKKMTIEQAAEYFIKTFSLNLTPEYIIKRVEQLAAMEYEHNIPLKKGAEKFLSLLDSKNIPYCAATSTYPALAASALKRLGIYERFKFIVTCQEFGKGKEYPDIYLHCAESLGGSPDETAVFEDALHCVETARNAGFFTVGVYDSANAPDWESICKIADKTIMSLEEAENILI